MITQDTWLVVTGAGIWSITMALLSISAKLQGSDRAAKTYWHASQILVALIPVFVFIKTW